MEIIECANCATRLTNQVDPCPNCGGTHKQILMNIQDVLKLDEEVSLSITQHNSFWNLLPRSLRFLTEKMNEPSFMHHGVGFAIQVMISSAMVVEGLLTDCIEEGIDRSQKSGSAAPVSEREIAYAKWSEKKKYCKDVLAIDIEQLAKYDEVDILFQIRNNIGHGRSYKVAHTTTFRNRSKPHSSEIEIKNKSYANVYRKLEATGLVPPLQQNSVLNIDMLFRPSIAKNLYDNSIEFLSAFLQQESIRPFEKIQRDFRDAFGITNN